ncbi:MAG TPA: hypothetical protein DCP85_10140 [Elusimicrobia bacterium]|nr:hypothetical protein [Elusimicrobiota bacterium]
MERPIHAEGRAAEQPEAQVVAVSRLHAAESGRRIGRQDGSRQGSEVAQPAPGRRPARRLAEQEKSAEKEHGVACVAEHRQTMVQSRLPGDRLVGQRLIRGQNEKDRAQHVNLGLQAPEPPRI